MFSFLRRFCFFFSSRRRHTRSTRDWSSDVCSSDLDHRKYSPNSPLLHYQSRPANPLVLHPNLQPHTPPRTRNATPRPFPTNSSLRRCFDRFDQEITSWIEHTKLAA